MPVVRSVAACSAALCAGCNIEVACPAIAIAPRAMPPAMNGTLIMRKPASVDMLSLTFAMPSLTSSVGPVGETP